MHLKTNFVQIDFDDDFHPLNLTSIKLYSSYKTFLGFEENRETRTAPEPDDCWQKGIDAFIISKILVDSHS